MKNKKTNKKQTKKKKVNPLPFDVDLEDKNVCPECGSKLIEKMSGIKCSKCEWWFCY